MSPRSGVTLTHIGVFVHDLEKMVDFYVGRLDFTVTDSGVIRRGETETQVRFLSRDPEQHHQIVLLTGRPAEISFNPINQISMKVPDLATLQAFFRLFREVGHEGLNPVTHGNAVSIYLPDPEGNRLEIYWDAPWYVPQPLVEPVDLSLPVEELLVRLEAQARSLPGFKPRAEWQQDMKRRMGIDDMSPVAPGAAR